MTGNDSQAGRHPIVSSFRETLAFLLVLSGCVTAFFHESLIGGKVLSPADVLFVSASFHGGPSEDYEPANRLLMDPVLQFQPWLEFNRRMIRSGRLPLWNSHAGCGVPHLANGQCAVFDPFHLIAYLGPTPRAYAWIAAGRLFTAGLGMFLLARCWGLGFWGRWFAGLVYPFCGFLIVWLLFPVTSVAIWMPWLFLAGERVFQVPGPRSAGVLAIVTALVLLGGHIQTSAHVLLAGGSYFGWRWWAWRGDGLGMRRVGLAWAAGTMLGIALAAVQIVPLAAYLAKSPVWGNRERDKAAWWTVVPPRWLDAVCTAIPYAYGSQRRGHPNLARALGVHNLNESAGGFAGLAAACWLAPLAIAARRRSPRVAFLAVMVAIGALGAFRLPPVDNLMRAIPVLDVVDNRRLALWVAFGLTVLGGIGLDHLGESSRLARGWIALWIVGAIGLGSSALVIAGFEPSLRARAVAHYEKAAVSTPGADPAAYRRRAERQVLRVIEMIPRVHGLGAAELGLLCALAIRVRRTGRSPGWMPPALLGLTLVELGLFGYGLNPAIAPRWHEYEPPVIARLRRGLPPEGRSVGLGAELPPNVLMRFGLADPRNYDSVELASSLEWFDLIFETRGPDRTSRRDVTWESAIRGLDRLRESGVGAIVAAHPPPEGAFERVENLGCVWIAWLEARPWAEAGSSAAEVAWSREPGRAIIRLRSPAPERITVRETWDPGWTARLDGRPVAIEHGPGPFFSVRSPEGEHRVLLDYDPAEVRVGGWISAAALACAILVLTGIRPF
jgi:hypothetical protein